ncbi:probable glutamate receptor isoform X2 [Limulus polyphemus]|uniref:Probable glutamate receptor isoform X2 n=1 Tax=Limulus polyphemus TaxID=6850 RepID=A0ABM1BBX7_LIMPO|nr:probable glutamate receptor isoform X2 [Limulus polyphemus]
MDAYIVLQLLFLIASCKASNRSAETQRQQYDVILDVISTFWQEKSTVILKCASYQGNFDIDDLTLALNRRSFSSTVLSVKSKTNFRQILRLTEGVYSGKHHPPVVVLCKDSWLPTLIQEDKDIFRVSQTTRWAIFSCNNTRHIATWTTSEGFTFLDTSQDKSKYERLDFQGRLLRVGTLKKIPHITYHVRKDENVIGDEGIENSLLNTIAEHLNFSYKLVLPPDGMFGAKENGTWSGIMGMVMRKEVDMGLTALVVTYEREEDMDFTVPYNFEFLTFVTAVPGFEHRALAIIRPFTWQMWIVLILTLAFSGILMNAVDNISAKVHRTSRRHLEAFWFIIGNLTSQGHHIEVAPELSVRCMAGAWLLVAVVLLAAYCGPLTSHVTFPTPLKPIDKVGELQVAVKSGAMKAGTLQGTSYFHRFMLAEDGVLKYLADKMRKHPSWVMTDIQKGIERALKSPYAFIHGRVVLSAHAAMLGRDRFHVSTDCFFSDTFAFPLQDGSPLKAEFDKVIRRIWEAGLVVQWEKEQLRRYDNRDLITTEDPTDAFTLVDIQGAFILFGMGNAMALIAFVVENIIQCLKWIINSKTV